MSNVVFRIDTRENGNRAYFVENVEVPFNAFRHQWATIVWRTELAMNAVDGSVDPETTEKLSAMFNKRESMTKNQIVKMYNEGTLFAYVKNCDDPTFVLENGTKEWKVFKRGAWHFHRLDGPAQVLPDGSETWWKYDEDFNKSVMHNENGPAMTWVNPPRTKFCLNGELHNENGPAYVSPEKTEYRIMGRLHRIDGPAIIESSGTVKFYLNGKQHNESGPAVIPGPNCGPIEYRIHGELGRIDGPALVFPNGKEIWFDKGKPISNELAVTLCLERGICAAIDEENGKVVVYRDRL